MILPDGVTLTRRSGKKLHGYGRGGLAYWCQFGNRGYGDDLGNTGDVRSSRSHAGEAGDRGRALTDETNMPRTLSQKMSQDVRREWRVPRERCRNLHCFSWVFVEATAGIEPACADLQSVASGELSC